MMHICRCIFDKLIEFINNLLEFIYNIYFIKFRGIYFIKFCGIYFMKFRGIYL